MATPEEQILPPIGEEEDKPPKYRGTPRIATGKTPYNPQVLSWMQDRGLVEMRTVDRKRPELFTEEYRKASAEHRKAGKGVLKGELIDRPINLREEMKKDVGAWMVGKGLVEAPPPEPEPVPPGMQEWMEKTAWNPLRREPIITVGPEQVGVPDGPKFPQITFNPPTRAVRSAFKQVGDLIKADLQGKIKGQGMAAAVLEAIPRFVSGGYITFDAVMEAIEPGSAAEFRETERQQQIEALGYDPKLGREATQTIAGIVGLFPVFRGLAGPQRMVGGKLVGGGIGTRIAVRATTVPILQAAIRTISLGVPFGIAGKPEGKDTFLKRLEQTPSALLFFAVFESGALGIGQAARILNWNKNYTGFRFRGGGRRPGYGPGVKVTTPEGGGFEFTGKDIQNLYNKMKAKAAGRTTEAWTEIDTAIIDLFNQSPGWRRAINEGMVKGFGRKPGMMDIFKPAPKPFAIQPGEPFQTQAVGRPAPPAGAAPGPQPTPSPTRGLPPGEIAPPRPGEAPPVAEPPAVPGEPLGLPEAPRGMRRPENLAKRRVIDTAIADFEGKIPAKPEDLEFARGMLEHEKMAGIGNAQLSEIQERKGVYKYVAMLDVKDLRGWNDMLTHEGTDQQVFSEIQDRLERFNEGDNPITWRASRYGGDEFTLRGNDPQELQADVNKLNEELKGVVINGKPIELVAGFGASLEEADKNFYLTKNAGKVGPTETVGTARAEEAIYHWTKEENIEKIYDTGFNTKLPPLFGIGQVDIPKGKKGYAPAQKMGRGILYFTKDPERWASADIFVGEGKGDLDYSYYDYEKQAYIKVPNALRKTPLKSIEAFLKPDARILTIDSLKKAQQFVRTTYTRDALPALIKAAKKAGYDVLEVKHAPGEWEYFGKTDKYGSKDLYKSYTGGSGKHDFFVYNRKALRIPAATTYKTRKIMASRAKASMARGIVGWPKGKVKIYDDIFAVTGGRGIKPAKSVTTGKVSSEFTENVPKFMVSKSPDALSFDEVQDALEKDYGYSFVTEDIYSLLKQAAIQYQAGEGIKLGEAGEEWAGPSKEEQEQAAERIQDDINLLKKEGEGDDEFWARMEKETRETGFGDDVGDYFYTQVRLKGFTDKLSGRGGGTEEGPAFKVARAEPRPLPVQPKIPEEGLYTAVRTDDGGIYFGKEPNHYLLVEKLGLPAERVIGGGFIRDGVYNESPWSEAGRIGRDAREALGLPREVFAQVKDLREEKYGTATGVIPLESPPQEILDELAEAARLGKGSDFVFELLEGKQAPDLSPGMINGGIEFYLNKLTEQDRARLKPSEIGVLGESTGPSLGIEKAIPMQMRVDAVRAWNNAAVTKYGDVALGDKALQEAQQNAVDAVIMALKSGEISEGKIHLKFRDGLIEIEDNGIGMSDEDVANVFLSLYGTGKTIEGAIGNFGIGKAVILGPHEQTIWSLETRDNYVDSAIVKRAGGARAVPKRQGTKLSVTWPFEKQTNKEYYQDVMTEVAPLYVLLNSVPKDKIKFTWEKAQAPEKFDKTLDQELLKRPQENLLDRIEGVKKEAAGAEGITFEIMYYPLPELDKLDAYWRHELKLPSLMGWMDVSKYLSRNVLYRIAHPTMPEVRLIQNIARQYNEGYSGLLVVDILTKIKPEDPQYPLADNRQSFKSGELNSQVLDIVRSLSQDPESSMRAAIKSNEEILAGRGEWKQTLDNVHNNPVMIKLRQLIRMLKTDDGKSILPLNLHTMKIKIDEGYEQELGGSEENAIFLTVYDAVAKIFHQAADAPYKELYALLSRELMGKVVASEYSGSRSRLPENRGRLGLNHNLYNFDSKRATNPSNYAVAVMEYVAHEFTHEYYSHGEKFDMKFTEILNSVAHRFGDLLGIAEVVTGKPVKITRLPKKTRTRSSSGMVREIPADQARDLTAPQMQLNLDMMEVNDVSDPIYQEGGVPTENPGADGQSQDPPEYAIRRVRDVAQPGLFPEGPQGARRPADRDRPELDRTTGLPLPRGAAEQPRPPGAPEGQPPGVGVRQDRAVVSEEPFALAPPEEKAPPLRPEPAYVPREGERLPQGVLPMPEAAPLYEGAAVVGPSKEEIANTVTKLTTGKNFPTQWVGNTPEEIQDNRQNVLLYAMEHYNPSTGPLENYVNSIKRHFLKGEMPSGERAVAFERQHAEVQWPEAGLRSRGVLPSEALTTAAQPDFPEAASVFGEETGPVGKPPAEPEYAGLEAREEAFGSEEIRVINVLRTVAQRAARGDVVLEERYNEILRSRLMQSPESFASLGKRLGMSKSVAHETFQNLLAQLTDSDAIKQMMKDRMIKLGLGPVPNEEDLRRLAKWIRKFFFRTRGATVAIDRQNDERLGSKMAEIFDQTVDVNNLRKWLDKQPAAVNDYLMDLYAGDITGNGYNDIMNSHLPQDVKDNLLRLRRRSDRLSELIVTYGALPAETEETFQRNMSKYLMKAYRLFEDKHWSPTTAQKAAFKRDLMTRYQMTDDEAEAFVQGELAYARNDEGIRPVRKQKTKRIPTESYIHRKELSPAWREFAGEIERLPWLLMKTVTKQATMAYNAKFLSWLANSYGENTPRNPGGLWTKDPERARKIRTSADKAESWIHSRLPDDHAYGELRGAFVAPELFQYVKREIDYARSEMEQVIQKFVMNPFKWTKTIGSYPTHMRNLEGNIVFSVLARNSLLNPLNWKYYGKAFQIIKGLSTTHRAEWAEMIKHGVTETQFYGAEIPRMHDKIMNFDDPEWYEKLWDAAVSLPIDKLGEFYNFEDSWYRVAAHLHNLDRGMSAVESVAEVNDALPNYRKLPLIADFLRRWPFLGPFISFRWNAATIILKQAERGYQEASNPRTRGRGFGRLITAATVLALPSIMSEVSKRIFDVDDEKVRQLESYYPDYRRNGTFVYFRMHKDGPLKVFDLSYINPFGEFERFGKALATGDIVSMKDAADFFSHPLFDVWSMLIAGRDPQWGTEYNTFFQRLSAVAAYLYMPASMPIPDLSGVIKGHLGPGENVRPGILTGPQIKAIIDAYNQNPDRYGRIRHLPEEIKNFFTGIRTWDVDPMALMAGAVKDRMQQKSDAKADFDMWLKKNSTAPQWQVDEKAKARNKRMEAIGKEMEAIGKLVEELEKDGFLAKRTRY